MANRKEYRHDGEQDAEYFVKASNHREYYVEVTSTDRRLFSALEIFRSILLMLVGAVGCLIWTHRQSFFPVASQSIVIAKRSDGASFISTAYVAKTMKMAGAVVTENSLSQPEESQSRRSHCERQFGERRFLSKEEEQTPIILFSYPGSGNTWSRLLIDYATGVYSGSLYNDTKLYKALPGEAAGCTPKLSVFKVHPDTAPVEKLPTIGTCKDQQTIKEFKRFIVVTRHPIDAFWSNYQREMLRGDHSKVLTREMFKQEHFAKRQVKLTKMFMDSWKRYDEMEATVPTKDILYIRYEDLKNPGKRMASLTSMVDFLGMGTTDSERLECAFVLSDRPDTHRQEAGTSSIENKDESSTAADEKMSKYDALAPYGCEIWSKVALYAETPRGGGHSLDESLQGLQC